MSPANVEELTPVPLIVKAPGAATGAISDAYARTLDVTPTIADVLGLPLGYRSDGRSAFGRAARRQPHCQPRHARLQAGFGSRGRRWEARAARGRPAQAPAVRLGRAGLYTGIGPNRELIGKRDLGTRARPSSRVLAPRSSTAVAAPPDAARLGRRALAGGRRPDGRPSRRAAGLAVAVAGRIEAVGGASTWTATRSSTTRSWCPRPRSTTGTTAVGSSRCPAAGGLRLLARS